MDLNGTNVAAPVVPFSDYDIFPTHYAQYGRGGWRSVKTIEDRDTIPYRRLEHGAVVYVEETDTAYVCKANNNGSITYTWQELKTNISKITTKQINSLFSK